MDIFSTVVNTYLAFMPEDKNRRTAKKWKEIAQRNAMVIVGMVLGTQATVEQLKQIKEILEKKA